VATSGEIRSGGRFIKIIEKIKRLGFSL
jgi:hypothetical protein